MTMEDGKKTIAVEEMKAWTLDVAAPIYGMTVQDLRRKCVDGTIKGTQAKKGGTWRVTPEAMDEYFNKSKQRRQ